MNSTTQLSTDGVIGESAINNVNNVKSKTPPVWHAGVPWHTRKVAVCKELALDYVFMKKKRRKHVNY